MSARGHTWRALSRVGVNPLVTGEARSIVATNQFAALASLVSIPYIVFFVSTDWPQMRTPALTLTTTVAWWVLAIVLNHYHHPVIASSIAIFAPIVEFAYLAHWFTTDSGFHYFLFAGGLLSFALFRPEQWMMRATFTLLSVGAFLVVRLYWPPSSVHHPFDHGMSPGLVVANVCLTTLLLYSISRFDLLYYERERDRNAALLAAAQIAAQTDALTDVYNRRGIAPILSAVARRGEYALALVDLDRFKLINDRLGHGAGDVVLANAARTLVRSVGDQGTIARWGGEEFLVVLPGLSVVEADELMERARADMEAEYGAIDSLARVTISVGVAHAPRYSGKEEVLRLADANLYEAKSAGRNVVVSARLPTPGRS